jgi:hypothetical protein
MPVCVQLLVASAWLAFTRSAVGSDSGSGSGFECGGERMVSETAVFSNAGLIF